MSSNPDKRVEIIFHAALERSVDERSEFLEEACGSDVQLRARIDALLSADHQADAVMGSNARIPQSAVATADTEQLIGKRFGRYVVRELIAEGGMGAVYLAEQDSPRRTVALKLIRSGYSTPSTLRRFELEAQTLGRLQHPGIAQIFEAGTDEHGNGSQAYFVMEYIEGRPLTDHANEKQLGSRQRLELFTQICDAVQHAHQKGVIHRDLKPDNILVVDDPDPRRQPSSAAGRLSSTDAGRLPGLGQVKVLDFGVARATDADMQLTTFRTDVGQLVGTIPYMSPEQATGQAPELDTRSDVYALGVNLYQLLTGRLPYDLRGKSIPEAVRIVSEQEHTPLSSVNRFFRGDLDTVVAKALEKEKDRRYQSAAELAADIRRYLRDEPIAARPISAGYQLRKFARRNRALVGGVITTMAALVIGLGVSIWQAVRATHAEEQAEADRIVATEQAARAQAVSRFLTTMLASIRPETARERDKTLLLEVLQDAEHRIQSNLKNQPEVEATLREAIGMTYLRLSRYDAAAEHLETCLRLREENFPEDHPELATALYNLGELRQNQTRFDEADDLLRQALAMRSRLGGSDSPLVSDSLGALGLLLMERTKMEEAEEAFTEAIRIARNATDDDRDRRVAACLNNLGMFHALKGDHEAAVESNREALELNRAVHDDEHPEVARSMNNLGTALFKQGAMAEAEQTLRDALDLSRRVFGNSHTMVADTLHNLAATLAALQRTEEAESLFHEALKINKSNLGDNHPSVAEQLRAIADLLYDTRQYEKAIPRYREVLAIQVRVLDEDDDDIAYTKHNLANALGKTGQYDEAERLEREAMATLRKAFGDEHPSIATMRDTIANFLLAQGKVEAAEAMHRETLAMRRRLFGDEHPAIGLSLYSLGRSLQSQERFAEARPLQREALDVWRNAYGPDHGYTQRAMSALADCLAEPDHFDEAEAMLRTLLESRRRTFPEGHWRIVACESRLGEVIAALRRFDQAEPLVLDAYHHLKENPAVPAPTLDAALRRVVSLYDEWGRPEEADRYRELLPPEDPPPASE